MLNKVSQGEEVVITWQVRPVARLVPAEQADQSRVGTIIDELLTHLQDGSAIVPNIWHLEIGNMLTQAEKRGRISAAQITTRLELLSNLPITVDTETAPRRQRGAAARRRRSLMACPRPVSRIGMTAMGRPSASRSCSI